jgi:hypothetical protein
MTNAGMFLIGIGFGAMISTLTFIYVMTKAVEEDRIKTRLRKEYNLTTEQSWDAHERNEDI